jgi:hypothetical protein
MKTKGLVPVIVVKVHLSIVSGCHSLEFIIKHNMVLRCDLPSGQVQNQWNGVTMLDTIPNINTTSGARLPPWELEST